MPDQNSSSSRFLRKEDVKQPSADPANSLIDGIVRFFIGLGILGSAFYAAWWYPTAPLFIFAGLLLYLLFLLKYPAAWLIVIPAVIPILELGFWSGRVYFSEFDLLLLVTIGGVLCRRRISLEGMPRSLLLTAAVLFLYAVFVTWNGLFPFHAGGLGLFNDQLSSLNGLRQSKGFFAALILLPLLWSEGRNGTNIAHVFAIGMIVGSICAGATIVWERLIFTDLWNFTDAYRVSGMFFGTLTGGAAVDAYLMLTAPFLGVLILYRPSYIKFILACAVAALAAYCVYVTYSRANYPATFAAILVFALGAWLVSPWRMSLRPRFVVAGIVAFTIFAGAAYHLLVGTAISKRFAQTMGDMQTRMDHWSHAVRIVLAEPSGKWIGAGRGTFPLKYYVDRAAADKRLVAPKLTRTDADNFITLTPGSDSGVTYLRQRLRVSASNKYRLQLKVRGGKDTHEYLIMEFCERHVLKFLPECEWHQIEIPKNTTDWRVFNVNVNLGHLGKETFGLTWRKFGQFTRPMEIAILNRGIRQKIDIADVTLAASDGEQFLRNGSFDQGMDHWFISYGDHLRWHIKNVFVYIFFEGGTLGLVVLALLLAVVAYKLKRRIIARDGFAVLYASALTGIVFVGLFDSLLDEPRIALLISMLIWLALIPSPSPIPPRGLAGSSGDPHS
jgi:hypothetical protein